MTDDPGLTTAERLAEARIAMADRVQRGYTGAVSDGEAFTMDIIAELEAAAQATVQTRLEALEATLGRVLGSVERAADGKIGNPLAIANIAHIARAALTATEQRPEQQEVD